MLKYKKSIILKLKDPKVLFGVFIVLATLFLTVSLFYTLRSYNDYVYGKFDLGNMNQMLFNSSRGEFMRITDQFGGDSSRFSMSHVDPSLLIFIPVYWFYSDAAFLVIVTCLTFYISAILLYFIALKEGLSAINAVIFGLLVYLLPITGYIIVWTAFHPLILAIPAFLGMYLWFLINKERTKITKKSFFVLILFFVIYTLSKEELGLVFAFLTPFLIMKFQKFRKELLVFALVGVIWTLTSFLIIIPSYASERATHTSEFLNYIGVNIDEDRLDALSSENFFLVRYKYLGTSYREIFFSVLKNPFSVISPLFSPENIEVHKNLFGPTLFTVFLSPMLVIALLPEVLIHGISGESGVYSIENHRLAMLIPIILLGVLEINSKLSKRNFTLFLLLVSGISLGFSVYTKNPLIYPVFLKGKHIVNANESTRVEWNYVLNPKCADYILKDIDSNVSVSVPQVLGAHTSNREYNALFPTGLDKAEVIVVDVLERKVTDFLDLDISNTYKALNRLLEDENLHLQKSCNRLMLLSKNPPSKSSNFKSQIIDSNDLDKNNSLANVSYKKSPYLTVWNYNITQDGNILNFEYDYSFTYEGGRHEKFAYTIFLGPSGEWQVVHLPSFYSNDLKDSSKEDIIKETFTLPIPSHIKTGETYEVYFGIGSPAYTKQNTKLGNLYLQ